MAKIVINYKLCKKCGICAAFCPKKVYTFNALDGLKAARETDCVACEKCVIMCPDLALIVTKKKA